MNKKLVLDKEKKDIAISKLKDYFLNERDEEIGDLAASLLIDFIIETVGPDIYNNGIKDSIAFMSEKIEDMYGLEVI